MSLTVTLSGKGSILKTEFFPPINLDDDGSYELGLINFQSFHSIANVNSTNNKFHYDENKEIEIPEGCYELNAINNYLRENIIRDKAEYAEDVITVRANNNTLKSEIKCKYSVDFGKESSIGSLLGFSPNRKIEPNNWYESDTTVNIIKINILRIECSITAGAYANGKLRHIIHEFFPQVPPGYKISETPANVIYLPLTVKTIDRLYVKISDQDDRPVDFGNEEITIRLHIRKC